MGQPDTISITAPLEEAWKKTRALLFEPFEMSRWFLIGFSAWLASIQGSFPSFRVPAPHDDSGHPSLPQIPPDWIPIVIVAAVVVVILVIGILLVLSWLSARGQFMFLDCLIKQRGAVKEPWRLSRENGWSLFVFQVFVMLAILLAVVMTIGIGLALAWSDIRSRSWGAPGILGLAFSGISLFVIILVGGAIGLVIHDIVVPLMQKTGVPARDAFVRACHLVREFAGTFLLYMLLRSALLFAAAIVFLVGGCCTCCIAFLPYIGTVLLLPLHVFLRYYPLVFLAQFGPDYDVWADRSGLTS